MKKFLGMSLTVVFCLGMSFGAGPAQASCPAGKAGHMESEQVVKQHQFRWDESVQTNSPDKATFDFASIPMESSMLLFTDDGTDFFGDSFSSSHFAGMPYDVDEWNNIKVLLNFNNDTFRVSVNGELSPPDDFLQPADEVDDFTFLYFATTERSGWLDSIKLITESGSEKETVFVENFQDNSPPSTQYGTLTNEQPDTTDPASGAKCPSTTSLDVDIRNGKIFAEGNVKPAHVGDKVVVKLFKLKDGKFVPVDTNKPTLDGSGYSTSFSRPNAARCRVKARFPGDDDHASSQKAKTFDC